MYEGWVMVMIVGFMVGVIIVFLILVGLVMFDKCDYKYMVFGVMLGVLMILIGVFILSVLIMVINFDVCKIIFIISDLIYEFMISYFKIILNLFLFLLFVVLLVVGLYFLSDLMIKGFMWFGCIMDVGIKLVFVFFIVEIFMGLFFYLFGSWGFYLIMVDKVD